MVSEPSSLPALPPGRDERAVGTRAAILGSPPGRLLVVGALVKLVAWLIHNALGVQSSFIDTIGALGSIAVVVGLVYFLYKLIVRAKRRLLWRVRRKLILSYIFVGVVPVLLVVAFFVLAGMMVFLNVSSYLVASSIRGVTDDAAFLASATVADIARANPSGRQAAREVRSILERKQATLAQRYPAASIALVPTAAGGDMPVGRVAVGPWQHMPPPDAVPAWVGSGGFAGLIAVSVPGHAGGANAVGLIIRAAAVPAGQSEAPFAVVVDVPLDAAVAARIRDETSVKLGQVTPVYTTGDVTRPDEAPSAKSLLLPSHDGNPSAKRRIGWVTTLEWRHWVTGARESATMSIEVNLADIYDRISSARFGSYTFGTLAIIILAALAGLFFIIEIVALIMGLVLARSITGSVHELFTGTGRVREGDFSHKITIRTRDQMGELADSFNQMTASIEDLLQQAAEKRRLEEELRIAREIQMSLLPRGALSIPGLSITALCRPAREVGGDYYDLLPLANDRLGVLIADVAGKGTSAAFYMAELKGVILSLSRIYASPRQLLIEANRIIARHLDSRSFITMTYAVLDLTAGTITYARAGHTPLMHRAGDGNGGATVRVLTPDGLVVGLQMDDGGALFERLLREETLPLRRGELFVFFTDGISEAMNPESECFGEERLGEILNEHGDLPSEELRERILREIDAFVAGAPQSDDMTMILLRVEEKFAQAPPARAVEAVGPGTADRSFNV